MIFPLHDYGLGYIDYDKSGSEHLTGWKASPPIPSLWKFIDQSLFPSSAVQKYQLPTSCSFRRIPINMTFIYDKSSEVAREISNGFWQYSPEYEI